jgi:hypothetical protein
MSVPPLARWPEAGKLHPHHSQHLASRITAPDGDSLGLVLMQSPASVRGDRSRAIKQHTRALWEKVCTFEQSNHSRQSYHHAIAGVGPHSFFPRCLNGLSLMAQKVVMTP